MLYLSGAAEFCIQAMHLNVSDTKTIRSCIQKHTLPESFPKKLRWTVYRVTQTIKSVFGRSDWQVANQIIETRLIQACLEMLNHPEHPVTAQESSQRDRLATVMSRLPVTKKLTFSWYSEEILSIALFSHQGKSEVSDELRRQGLGILDLKNYTSDFINKTIAAAIAAS